jgi:PAS domain-containing protein
MPGGEDSKKWLISELTALRRSVSEIQDRLGDYVEEPTDEFGSKVGEPETTLESRVGLADDEREKLARYRSFFEYSPVALWCHDASDLKAYLHALRNSGATDLRAHLRDHPECLVQCTGRIRVLEANVAALKLFKAPNKETFFSDFPKFFSERTYNSFVQYFIGVADGKMSGQRQVVLYTLKKEEIYALLKWLVVPGYEASLGMVLMSVIELAGQRPSE